MQRYLFSEAAIKTTLLLPPFSSSKSTLLGSRNPIFLRFSISSYNNRKNHRGPSSPAAGKHNAAPAPRSLGTSTREPFDSHGPGGHAGRRGDTRRGGQGTFLSPTALPGAAPRHRHRHRHRGAAAGPCPSARGCLRGRPGPAPGPSPPLPAAQPPLCRRARRPAAPAHAASPEEGPPGGAAPAAGRGGAGAVPSAATAAPGLRQQRGAAAPGSPAPPGRATAPRAGQAAAAAAAVELGGARPWRPLAGGR